MTPAKIPRPGARNRFFRRFLIGYLATGVALASGATAIAGSRNDPSPRASSDSGPGVPTAPRPTPSGDTDDTNRTDIEFGPVTGFTVDSKAVRANFEIHLALWLRFSVDAPPGEEVRPAFTVPLVRPYIQGSFFSHHLDYFVQPEFAGSPRLLDAFLQWNIVPAARFRLGQFRTPMSRAFINPIVQLQLPDRGIVDDSFRLDRDVGMMFWGNPFDRLIEYYAGIFNGAAINTLADDGPLPMAVARFVFNLGDPVPYDQVPAAQGPVHSGGAIGLNGAYRQHRVTVDPADEYGATEESWHAGADAAMMAGPVAATAEAFLTNYRVDQGSWDLSWGTFVQGGVFVWPRILELVARAGWMDRSIESADWLRSYEAGINGYIATRSAALGHHLKAQARYALDRSSEPFTADSQAGIRHRVTFQVQLWF